MSEEQKEKKPAEDLEAKAETQKDAEGQLSSACGGTSWDVCLANNNMKITYRCQGTSQSTCGVTTAF